MPVAAFGMSAAIADQLAPMISSSAVDVSGVGGTLTGNALALAAVRATLGSTLGDDDFAHTIPLANEWTAGVQAAIDRHRLPWHVQQLGSRAEYWFCAPPRNGATAAAAVDEELDAFMHLWAVNRGILLTPFHNMALMSPHHTQSDVAAHSEAFAEAVECLAS
jgi:glutamate-1-semialdehyde 2,1-aminomutase